MRSRLANTAIRLGVMTILLACIVAPAALAEIWGDDFDGKLRTAWTWLREDESHWSLSDRPGFLTIITQQGGVLFESNNARNLLLRDLPDGDFVVATYMEFLPTQNYHFAGLIIYQDDDNLIALGRAFCDPSLEGCSGNGIYFDYERAGELRAENFDRSDLGIDKAYLKLVREGSTYYGYYSEDGEAWISIGAHTATDLRPQKVGLYAADSDQGATEAPAHFATFILASGDSAATSYGACCLGEVCLNLPEADCLARGGEPKLLPCSAGICGNAEPVITIQSICWEPTPSGSERYNLTVRVLNEGLAATGKNWLIRVGVTSDPAEPVWKKLYWIIHEGALSPLAPGTSVTLSLSGEAPPFASAGEATYFVGVYPEFWQESGFWAAVNLIGPSDRCP